MELPSSIFKQPHSKKEVVVFFGLFHRSISMVAVLWYRTMLLPRFLDRSLPLADEEVVGRVLQCVAPPTGKAAQKPPLVNGKAVLAITKLSAASNRPWY